MPVTPDQLRPLKGSAVRLRLSSAAGGGSREGTVAGTTESADGLVLFVAGADGRSEAIHYQLIESIEKL